MIPLKVWKLKSGPDWGVKNRKASIIHPIAAVYNCPCAALAVFLDYAQAWKVRTSIVDQMINYVEQLFNLKVFWNEVFFLDIFLVCCQIIGTECQALWKGRISGKGQVEKGTVAGFNESFLYLSRLLRSRITKAPKFTPSLLFGKRTKPSIIVAWLRELTVSPPKYKPPWPCEQ